MGRGWGICCVVLYRIMSLCYDINKEFGFWLWKWIEYLDSCEKASSWVAATKRVNSLLLHVLQQCLFLWPPWHFCSIYPIVNWELHSNGHVYILLIVVHRGRQHWPTIGGVKGITQDKGVGPPYEAMPWKRFTHSVLILGLCPSNERHSYKVMPRLIGWAQTENKLCILLSLLGESISHW